MRISHAPPDYDCPFCRIVEGKGSERTRPEHVLRRYPQVTVFMNPRWWENNRGNVLVVPNGHFENVYELPPEYGTPILEASRHAALAMKAAYACDGVSTRQHNEPAGNQEVWHYHLHVFPEVGERQLLPDPRLLGAGGRAAGDDRAITRCLAFVAT